MYRCKVIKISCTVCRDGGNEKVYQINDIYKLYDSGGYDHLMRYPSTVVPRLDISYRRKHLIDYTGEHLEKNESTYVFGETCSFDIFCYTLQMQSIGEPLMHRLNQDTKHPELGYSEVLMDKLREAKKEMANCLNEVYGLLGEMLESGDPCTAKVLNRNDILAERAKELIEEIL